MDPQIVTLEEGVVPEPVGADARVETEVDEGDWRDACLVVGPEGEEVVERIRQIRALSCASNLTVCSFKAYSSVFDLPHIPTPPRTYPAKYSRRKPPSGAGTRDLRGKHHE